MSCETANLHEEIDPDVFLAYDFSGIEADNQRYRLALESIDIGVFEYYPPIDHFEANYIWYQLTGLRRGDGLKEILANVAGGKASGDARHSREERAELDGSYVHVALQASRQGRAMDFRDGIRHLA